MHYTQPDVYEFISKQTNDPIVERKICRISGTNFAIYQSDRDFYDKISPVFNGVKYQIPTPTLCPEERQRRRESFRNERHFYRRTCAITDQNIISIYQPNSLYIVYKDKERWKDNRDPLHKKEYDITQGFNETYNKLLLSTPLQALHINDSENSEYVTRVTNCKDCYLSFDTRENQSTHYCCCGGYSSDCMDCYGFTNLENCYNCINTRHASLCFYCINCESCDNSLSLINCTGCSHCIDCENLVNKKYYYQNQPCSPQEFERIWSEKIRTASHNPTYTPAINQGLHQKGSSNSYSNDVWNSNNINVSNWVFDSEDIKYSNTVARIKDSYDSYESGLDTSLVYECHGGMSAYKSAFINTGYHLTNCYYMSLCYNCSDCFGCVSIRNKQYCIFNRQYPDKESYEKAVVLIIEQMIQEGTRGEFFDTAISPFGYNETTAMDHYPMSKKEVLNRGYKWSDYVHHINIPSNAETIHAVEYDDKTRNDITNNDDIVDKVIICETSGKPFRIIKQELEFYRKYNLPVPREHPDSRYQKRLDCRDGKAFSFTCCDSCEKAMVSVYTGNHPGDVYCEDCYNKAIYS